MPISKNSSGVYRPNAKTLRNSRLSRSAHVPDPGQVRNGYARAFEPSPEDGPRTKLFDQEFQFRESHTEAETEKLLTESPQKRMIVCITQGVDAKA